MGAGIMRVLEKECYIFFKSMNDFLAVLTKETYTQITSGMSIPSVPIIKILAVSNLVFKHNCFKQTMTFCHQNMT